MTAATSIGIARSHIYRANLAGIVAALVEDWVLTSNLVVIGSNRPVGATRTVLASGSTTSNFVVVGSNPVGRRANQAAGGEQAG